MFRSFDNFILQRSAQVAEVVAVSCNPYYQITVILRILLRIEQGLPVYDIKLYMMTVHLEI